jgi:hypothetical protein
MPGRNMNRAAMVIRALLSFKNCSSANFRKGQITAFIAAASFMRFFYITGTGGSFFPL